MAEWSAQKKWWMDVLKNGVTLTVGALITYGVLQSVEDSIADRRATREARFGQRAQAAAQFRTAATSFLGASQLFDFQVAMLDNHEHPERLQWPPDAPPPGMRVAIAGVTAAFGPETAEECRQGGLSSWTAVLVRIELLRRQPADPTLVKDDLAALRRHKEAFHDEYQTCEQMISLELREDPFGEIPGFQAPTKTSN